MWSIRADYGRTMSLRADIFNTLVQYTRNYEVRKCTDKTNSQT
jgi:hypothetical protein